jgi:hypothetical protein
MRTLIFPLVFQLLLSIPLHTNNQSSDGLEHKAIKVLLDSLHSIEPNNNLGVIIYYGHQCDILAWFKYRHDNEFITIDYFIFSSKTVRIERNYKKPLHVFLEKIIQEKKLGSYLNPYQIETLIPSGLQKKTILDLIYSDKRFNTTKDGWIQIAPKECPPFTWGFRRTAGESSEYDSNYMINPLGEIILEIMDPIITNVLWHNLITQINQALRK